MSTTFKNPFHPTVSTSLSAEGAAKLADFIVSVFGGVVEDRYDGAAGELLHSEIRVGDSMLMVSEPFGGAAFPASLFIYVPDVDATFARAVAAGATSLDAPEDGFSGQRIGRVKDVWGNRWSIATQKKQMTRAEVRVAFDQWMASMAAPKA